VPKNRATQLYQPPRRVVVAQSTDLLQCCRRARHGDEVLSGRVGVRLLEQRNGFADRSKQRGGNLSTTATSCIGLRLPQQAEADQTVDGI
jgi:hypothetical protein